MSIAELNAAYNGPTEGPHDDRLPPQDLHAEQSVLGSMLLNKDANDYNNRAVEFRLEERIPNTTQWRVYEKAIYTLKRSFTSDFDF